MSKVISKFDMPKFYSGEQVSYSTPCNWTDERSACTTCWKSTCSLHPLYMPEPKAKPVRNKYGMDQSTYDDIPF